MDSSGADHDSPDNFAILGSGVALGDSVKCQHAIDSRFEFVISDER